MAINSKVKGSVGEREVSHILNQYGYKTRRGQQFCGAQGDADVIGIPGLHIEVKRVEKLNIENAMRQAKNDAREGEIPAVFHRRNRESWKVTIGISDFIKIWREYEKRALPKL